MKKAIFKYQPISTDKFIGLNEAQDQLIKILDIFQRFCETYSIKISLAYGSLLGAIRDCHIIPWDDDIDLMLDTENLAKLKSHLGDLEKFGLSYYHYSTHSNIYTNEYRIYLPNYFRILENNGKKFITPLCVDIFNICEIDVTSDGNLTTRAQKKVNKIAKYKDLLVLKEAKYNSKNKLRAFLRNVKKLLILPITSNHLHKSIDKEINSLASEGNKHLLFSPLASDRYEVYYKTNLFEKTEKVEFGNIKAYCVCNYDEFLEKNYSDWRTPRDRSNGETLKSIFLYRKD